VPRPDPDHVAAIRHQPAEQRRGEAQRGPPVRRAAQLVQAAAHEPAAGQGAIDPGQAERQDRATTAAARLQPGEPGTQPLDHGPSVGRRGSAIDLTGFRRHGGTSRVRVLYLYVRQMFYSYATFPVNAVARDSALLSKAVRVGPAAHLRLSKT